MDVVFIIAAYLLGSFPYMVLLAKAKGIDLSQEPDLHAALWHKVGRLEGSSGIAIDVLKGIIPVIIGFFLNLKLDVVAFAVVAAVIGQMWPVFRKFDGEKGNTPGLGTVLALSLVYKAYLVIIISFTIILAGFLIRTTPRIVKSGQTTSERLQLGGPASDSLPLAMLIGFGSMPLVSWLINQPTGMTLALLIMFITIVVRRLTADLRSDIKERNRSIGYILLNRFLLDRSYH